MCPWLVLFHMGEARFVAKGPWYDLDALDALDVLGLFEAFLVGFVFFCFCVFWILRPSAPVFKTARPVAGLMIVWRPIGVVFRVFVLK